ncbi:hypothetical protein Sgou_06090 [Streptomyces gougerotii]|uniref:Uncharacterized protein n=1 Tax=Streptomyces gougerotii TaxID=53448 RepID=A0ABQ1D0I2_9ACTN|nr:hypothetical protein Sgou_06090 [Streptomyces gougerotii]
MPVGSTSGWVQEGTSRVGASTRAPTTVKGPPPRRSSRSGPRNHPSAAVALRGTGRAGGRA